MLTCVSSTSSMFKDISYATHSFYGCLKQQTDHGLKRYIHRPFSLLSRKPVSVKFSENFQKEMKTCMAYKKKRAITKVILGYGFLFITLCNKKLNTCLLIH